MNGFETHDGYLCWEQWTAWVCSEVKVRHLYAHSFSRDEWDRKETVHARQPRRSTHAREERAQKERIKPEVDQLPEHDAFLVDAIRYAY